MESTSNGFAACSSSPNRVLSSPLRLYRQHCSTLMTLIPLRSGSTGYGIGGHLFRKHYVKGDKLYLKCGEIGHGCFARAIARMDDLSRCTLTNANHCHKPVPIPFANPRFLPTSSAQAGSKVASEVNGEPPAKRVRIMPKEAQFQGTAVVCGSIPVARQQNVVLSQPMMIPLVPKHASSLGNFNFHTNNVVSSSFVSQEVQLGGESQFPESVKPEPNDIGEFAQESTNEALRGDNFDEFGNQGEADLSQGCSFATTSRSHHNPADAYFYSNLPVQSSIASGRDTSYHSNSRLPFATTAISCSPLSEEEEDPNQYSEESASQEPGEMPNETTTLENGAAVDGAISEEEETSSVKASEMKLPIKIVHPGEISSKISDIGGYEDAKLEVIELVNYLQNREQYHKLGAKVPKGTILFGVPGTGKTLMARSIAGEAQVPFIACNSSEFLLEDSDGLGGAEKLKGVFAKARELAPCILFFDEIDCIARARPSRHDPISVVHHALLECLLMEMDGFDDHSGEPVIVLGATNDEWDIDHALLRPGRFGRMISMKLPSLMDRLHIFLIHLRPLLTKLELDRKELAKKLAYLTPSFTGAKIFMVCNEAAMIAARDASEAIDWPHFEQALTRVNLGSSKPPVWTEKIRSAIAFHDAAHAVCGWMVEGLEPPSKLSLMPLSGHSIACAQTDLNTSSLICDKDDINNLIMQILAGKVAEEVFMGKHTTLCSNDLEIATQQAMAQISENGMSKTFGVLRINGLLPQNRCCDHSAPLGPAMKDSILVELKEILEQQERRAKEFVESHKQQIAMVAEALLAKELLTAEDLVPLLGPRKFAAASLFKADKDEDFLPAGLQSWNQRSCLSGRW